MPIYAISGEVDLDWLGHRADKKLIEDLTRRPREAKAVEARFLARQLWLNIFTKG